MTAPIPSGAPDLTRRQALQAGGATAAATFLFLHPWAGTVARAAEAPGAGTPRYLLRSSYVGLQDLSFRTASGELRLESVGDLPAAPDVPSFVDSEDAFLLLFSGPELPVGEPVAVRHADLGGFDLYLGPRQSGDRYVVVVNRVLSNRESRRTPPRPARQADPTPGSAAAPVDEGHDTPSGAIAAAPAGRPKVKGRNKVVRTVQVKRAGHGAKVVLDLASPHDLSEVAVWLKRDERILATASHGVHGHRVALHLKSSRRLRRGVYQLAVIAHGDDGEQHGRTVRVRIR